MEAGTRATESMEEPLSDQQNSTQLLLPTGLQTTQPIAQTVPVLSSVKKKQAPAELKPRELITALAQLQDAIYQFKQAGGQWREPKLRGAAMTMACRVPGHKVFIDDSGNFTFDGVSVMAPREEVKA